MLRSIMCLVACAGPAFANCPVAADLTNGITLQMGPDVSETYTRLPTGEVELLSTYSDGYVSRALLGQGVYLLEFADLEGGQIVPETQAIYALNIPTDALPIPTPDAVFRGRMVVTDSIGSYDDKIVARWGALEQMDIGGCTYDVIAGQLDSAGDGIPYQEGIHYLPALGFGYLASYLSGDMDTPDTYAVTGISKVGK
ncbi:hypothetical protein SAMN04488005_2231 [Yoonia tamlensis]|uniref:Uncharacterized protein n=1 Tax=Yoonia tamlensis TaxID=390270 RepID=A0A1I6GW11_9RHOB|nr:hypothetical protein [Yoonia tamlensis]SFR46269.1 hypothetical protein SAMN04488005_2231 [Yoonia tamlensis]